jgi:hypothetical protein
LEVTVNKFLLLLATAPLVAQTVTPIPPEGNVSSVLAGVPTPQSATVNPADIVFPHFAIGGGWQTTMVLVNMSPQTVNFNEFFFDPSGAPLQVTFLTIPQGDTITTSALKGTLPANQSFNFVLSNSAPLQTGYAVLMYDSINTRLGGFSIFQQSTSVGTFEALVPLSSITDYKFYMPFDNRAGFVTSMALVNVGSSPTSLQMTFRSTTGETISTRTLTLQAGQQISFGLNTFAPATVGVAGVLYVAGSGPPLSALGFRFNLSGAFATVPIMNWSGMFP